jgi:tetratricopeptide (TPR) repeat protein
MALERYRSYSRDWARVQNNLGTALTGLGERETTVADYSKQAALAYGNALKVYTRKAAPEDWAMTQTNLCVALKQIGERESGTEHLEQAVAAGRAALQVRTRSHTPLNWAMAKINLGNALEELGTRESGTQHLKEAVAAYRGALEVYTGERQRNPLDWARIQNDICKGLTDLGIIEWHLGQQKWGTRDLGEAVTACGAALEEIRRDREPFLWGVGQLNLGYALVHLGEYEEDPKQLCNALWAHTNASQVLSVESPRWAAKATAGRQRDLALFASRFPWELSSCLSRAP